MGKARLLEGQDSGFLTAAKSSVAKHHRAVALLLFITTSLAGPCGAASIEEIQIGRLKISSTQNRVDFRTASNQVISSAVLPGGKAWPWIFADERGRFYVGSVVLDSVSGEIAKHGTTGKELFVGDGVWIRPDDSGKSIHFYGGRAKPCQLSLKQLGASEQKKRAVDLLREREIVFAGNRARIVALRATRDADGEPKYTTTTISPKTCKVVSNEALGNPDLLIELNYSDSAGWWIVGSVEQTLLRSRNGSSWKTIKLPSNIYSLIDAMITNEGEIWLAAGLAEGKPSSGLMLIYSADDGETWTSVQAGDAALSKLPKHWLEGQLRAQLASSESR